MTIVYILLIVLQIAVIVYFLRQGKKKAAARDAAAEVQDTNTYSSHRAMALRITPEQLKLSIPAEHTLVYGVIMDWDMGDMVTTLAAYITGAASICFSTGGIVTGGGKKQEAAECAVDFVVMAQEYIGRAMPVAITDLPAKDRVRFYFLANTGIYGAQEETKHFEDGSSPWLPLFAAGSTVVNKIRE